MSSRTRVQDHTAYHINEVIRRRAEARIEYYRKHPEEIGERLNELNREWDVERALETGSSVLSLLGLALAITRNKKWLSLTFGVQGFFFQHAVQGWCPPLPILRRLGFRTVEEIDEERYMLKVIRGDFKELMSRRPQAQAEPEHLGRYETH